MVCLKPGEAQRDLKNKVEVKGWMRQANDLLDYYEAEGNPSPERR